MPPCSSFTDNYGSGITARSSLLYISGTVFFARNIGTRGGAIKVYDISRVRSRVKLFPSEDINPFHTNGLYYRLLTNSRFLQISYLMSYHTRFKQSFFMVLHYLATISPYISQC